MFKWLRDKAVSIRHWWVRRGRLKEFSGVAFCDSYDDPSPEISAYKLVVVGTAGRAKWLRFGCPCRCGETISLNLMMSHHPRWRVTLNDGGRVSVSPSVEATSCKSHFWIRSNGIDWM